MFALAAVAFLRSAALEFGKTGLRSGGAFLGRNALTFLLATSAGYFVNASLERLDRISRWRGSLCRRSGCRKRVAMLLAFTRCWLFGIASAFCGLLLAFLLLLCTSGIFL